MFSKKRLIGALVGLVFLAGCGGGGKTAALPTGTAATAVPGGTSQQPTSGTRLTFTINRGKPTHAHYNAASAAHRKTKSASAKRSPKYFGQFVGGLQVTASAAGATPITAYYDISGVNDSSSGAAFSCANDGSNSLIYTCQVTLPIVGSTENISVLEVDQTPSNENTATGQGTAFPVNSNVLAVGSAVATTSPGTLTNVSISLNPVVGQFTAEYEGINYSTNSGVNVGLDTNTSPSRLVVTASTPSQSQIETAGAYDIDDGCIYPLTFVAPSTPDPNPTLIGQPFVDVHGSPNPVTATSSTTHLGLASVPLTSDALPSPPPAGSAYAQTASIPSSTYTYDCFYLDLNYDGSNVATSATTGPTSATITLNDNQTAVPAAFTGPTTGSPAATTYAATYVYPVSFVDVYPTAIAYSGVPIVVTGFDAAAPSGMTVDSNSTCIVNNDFTITGGSYSAATGSQPFTISIGSSNVGNTCSFDLLDTATGVVTRSVQVTSNTNSI